MTRPIVSIVIPCHNAVAFIGEAIESALEQTYSPKEVIVIDDGSVDESVSVLKSYGDRIHWETGPNRGACAARNRGLAIARGELVQFLDADDVLYPEKLEIQVPIVAKSEKSFIFCDYHTSESSDSSCTIRENLGGDISDPVVFIVNRPQLQTSAPLHRRSELLEMGGFREHLPCCQDHDLHLRIACHGWEFGHLDQPLFLHRIREGSISSNYVRVLLQSPDVYWHAYHQLETERRMTDRRARAFSAKMAADARMLLRFGENVAAFQAFTDARRMHSSGGLWDAYRGYSRLMHHVVGPVMTERLVSWKRSFSARPLIEKD